MKDFSEKVVLVTGASSGIGFATAQAFIKKGAIVVLADIVNNNAVESLINQSNGEAVFVKTDVSKKLRVKELLNIIKNKFGRLDYAFNNAGILGAKGNIENYPSDIWEKVIDVNLNGIYYCMKYEIKVMKENKDKCVIVNTSSDGGLRVVADDIPAYIASKHGSVGLTKVVADQQSNSNINVHVLCPPGVDTPMYKEYTGVAGGIPADEVAKVVLWLCSPKAKDLNGKILERDDWVKLIAK